MCTIPMWIHQGCGHYTKYQKQICDRGKHNRCRKVPEKAIEDAPHDYIVCDNCERALRRSVAALFHKMEKAVKR